MFFAKSYLNISQHIVSNLSYHYCKTKDPLHELTLKKRKKKRITFLYRLIFTNPKSPKPSLGIKVFFGEHTYRDFQSFPVPV